MNVGQTRCYLLRDTPNHSISSLRREIQRLKSYFTMYANIISFLFLIHAHTPVHTTPQNTSQYDAKANSNFYFSKIKNTDFNELSILNGHSVLLETF